jgi:hypothetical protein
MVNQSQIKTVDNNNKKRRILASINNLRFSYIKFDDCEAKLKKFYIISDDIPLLIKQIDYDSVKSFE